MVAGVAIGGLVAVDRATANDGDEVLFVGDSITDWYRRPIQRAIGGTYGLTIVARAGATAEQMLPEAQARRDLDPDQVVINLGTNDINTGGSPERTEAEIRRIADQFPDAACIWVTTVNSNVPVPGGGASPAADELNARLADWAATDDRIDLIDWDRIVTEDIEADPPRGTPLTRDTVHPNEAGTSRLIRAYRKAIDGCGRPSFLW